MSLLTHTSKDYSSHHCHLFDWTDVFQKILTSLCVCMYTYTHRYVKNLRYINQSFLESRRECGVDDVKYRAVSYGYYCRLLQNSYEFTVP